MTSPFPPVEHAILCDWLGHPRPARLRGLDTCATDHDPDDGIVRVRPLAYDEDGTRAFAAAVAAIVLNPVHERLPQWACVSDTELVLGRAPVRRRRRTVEVLPQYLFTLNWADTAPGLCWPEAYHATLLPGFDRWVITASADGTDAYGVCDLAIGHFPEATPIEQGAREVICDWWRQRLACDGDAWVYLFDTGLIDTDQALAWREAVWPSRHPDEDEDDLEADPAGLHA